MPGWPRLSGSGFWGWGWGCLWAAQDEATASRSTRRAFKGCRTWREWSIAQQSRRSSWSTAGGWLVSRAGQELEPRLLLLRPILCILEAGDDLLTGLQADFSGSRRREPRAFGAAAMLCLALLALLAVVQVAHMHPLDRDADHCSLCISMHSAAPVAVMAAAVVMVKMGTPAPFVEARAVVRHWHPRSEER